MRIPRIYHPEAISLGASIALTDDAVQHVARVLRLGESSPLVLFNGDGKDYAATITRVDKRHVEVNITDAETLNNESPVSIHLGQGISRGDRMDFALQKSVELGVQQITPLFTERCGVKLSGERLAKKLRQWQKIVISACEQCGRATIPTVKPPQSLAEFMATEFNGLRLTLDPTAERQLISYQQQAKAGVQLVIGPEGGLTDTEIADTQTQGFEPIRLGPRILRTETAALAAITAIQYAFGDFA